MGETVLEVRDLCKRYGGTVALSQVNCSFSKGQVHAFLGKNGSGKSTFASIIAGVVVPTSGRIFLRGEEIIINSPQNAMKMGIALVHQEMSLIPSLSVAENIFLGRLRARRPWGRVDWKATWCDAEEVLARVGVDVNPRVLVQSLSVGQQQQIEIAKAITENPSLLILDEPTSALALKEVDKLFSIMSKLRSDGVTMIYISHRLQELSRIADTVSVLRDGHFVGTEKIADATSERILSLMFGQVSVFARAISASDQVRAAGEPLLEVKNFSRQPYFSNLSFALRKGEILGIAGLMGSGRTETLRSIFGLDKFDRGEIFIDGKKVSRVTPVILKRLGVGYVSEDRKMEGLVLLLGSHDNLTMAAMKAVARFGFFLTRKREKPFVDKQIKALSIKVSDSMLPVSSLSGGNQQKIVLGNWLNTAPRILLLDEPSRGIDVEAKQQIFQLIWALRSEGVSAIIVSSELEELHLVCDRILVLHQGGISKELLPSQTTVNELYQSCMAGGSGA